MTRILQFSSLFLQRKRLFQRYRMKVVLCVLAIVVSMVNAGLIAGPAAIVRTPQFDSAVIKSDRLGGNFAYSTAEAHAYAAINPIVQNVASPVAVSYSAHPIAAPAVAVHAVPALPALHAATLAHFR